MIIYANFIIKCKTISIIKQTVIILISLGLPDIEELSHFIKENRFYHIPLKTAEEVNNL